MDKTRQNFDHARRDMVEAFTDLLFLTRHADVDWDARSEIQGRFWDGNVEIKHAFAALKFAAEFRIKE